MGVVVCVAGETSSLGYVNVSDLRSQVELAARSSLGFIHASELEVANCS